MEITKDCVQNPLINELIQGRDLANQLRITLDPSVSMETRELLIEKVLSSFDKALLMLKCNSSGSGRKLQATGPSTGMLGSPHSSIGNPWSEDSDHDHRDISKKRKTLPRWTKQVRICGVEGPLDDGYSWRKYGQKDILGAKYPRGYYRCTYRNVQDCLATKQVQRSDEDPTIFEITYRGKHTCIQASHLLPATPASPIKQDPKQNPDYSHQQKEEQKSKEILLNFQTGLKVKTENLDSKALTTSSSFKFASTDCINMDNNIFLSSALENSFMGTFSPSFISPTTSESNYFSLSPCGINSFGGAHTFQTSESDITEIISATTSVTNSPILDIDFSLDPVDFDPNFPFDTLGF